MAKQNEIKDIFTNSLMNIGAAVGLVLLVFAFGAMVAAFATNTGALLLLSFGAMTSAALLALAFIGIDLIGGLLIKAAFVKLF